jgi:hypothetical protein
VLETICALPIRIRTRPECEAIYEKFDLQSGTNKIKNSAPSLPENFELTLSRALFRQGHDVQTSHCLTSSR